MIVPMKKVTLLCLESQKVSALEKLRDLGMMQLDITGKAESEESQKTGKAFQDAKQVYNLLESYAGKKIGKKDLKIPEISGEEAVRQTLELIEQKAALEKSCDSLQRTLEKLVNWGNVDFQQIQTLKDSGVYVYLCCSAEKAFDRACAGNPGKGGEENLSWPDSTVVQEVSRSHGGLVYYVLISRAELDEKTLELADVPKNITRDEAQAQLRANQEKIKEITLKLAGLASLRKKIAAYAGEEMEKQEFFNARDSMKKEGEIAYIQGYVPAPDLEKFRAAALEYGWAFMAEDPSEDDAVPTLIRKPKFLSIIDPLFEFIGVSPGYRENDVNAFFLFFFPIFVGMIIGDAGYATLFIVCSVIGKILLKGKAKAQLALNLFLLLSIYALVWGWLNGSWFGIPLDCLPGFMQGWSFFTHSAESGLALKFARAMKFITPDMTAEQVRTIMDSGFADKFVQFFCFVLAGIHLVSARLFKFADDIRGNWRALGHIGWALILAANVMMAVNLVVFPGTFPGWGMWLYYIGIPLVVVTIQGSAALNLPFSLIGSFTDVLSYIRLFAVGLASAYIAEKFNAMGVMLAGSFPD